MDFCCSNNTQCDIQQPEYIGKEINWHLWHVSIGQKNLSLHSPNRSSSWGTKKVQKLHHRVHSTTLPRHGGKGMTPKPQQPGLHLTLQNVPKKNSVSSSETSNHGGWRNRFYSLDVLNISVCLGISALFGTFWGLPDLVGSTKMSNGQPLAALAASSRRPQGAFFVCGTPVVSSCAYERNTFWDGNQTVRNEMLRTVWKIVLRFSSKN